MMKNPSSVAGNRTHCRTLRDCLAELYSSLPIRVQKFFQSDPIRHLSNPAINSFFTSQFDRKSSALSIEFVIEKTGVGLSEGQELATKRMVCQQNGDGAMEAFFQMLLKSCQENQ